MGCNMINQKFIQVKSNYLDINSTNVTNKNFPINITYISKKSQYLNYKKYQNIISKKSWKNILDFLPYQDLKETGKVNRKFNEICKFPIFTIIIYFLKIFIILFRNIIFIFMNSDNNSSIFLFLRVCTSCC